MGSDWFSSFYSLFDEDANRADKPIDGRQGQEKGKPIVKAQVPGSDLGGKTEEVKKVQTPPSLPSLPQVPVPPPPSPPQEEEVVDMPNAEAFTGNIPISEFFPSPSQPNIPGIPLPPSPQPLPALPSLPSLPGTGGSFNAPVNPYNIPTQYDHSPIKWYDEFDPNTIYNTYGMDYNYQAPTDFGGFANEDSFDEVADMFEELEHGFKGYPPPEHAPQGYIPSKQSTHQSNQAIQDFDLMNLLRNGDVIDFGSDANAAFDPNVPGPEPISFGPEIADFGSEITDFDAEIANDIASVVEPDPNEEGEEGEAPNAVPNKGNKPAIPNRGHENEEPDSEKLGFSLAPSPIPLPQESCHSSAGQLGECMSAYECGLEDGVPDGLCHQGLDASAHLRSCCIFSSYCGYETNKEITYLKNPDYPGTTSKGGDCIFKVDLLPGVCQIRLDFLELKLKPMVDGECDETNSLTIKSSVPHSIVPVKKLCGTVNEESEDADPLRTDLPHLYVHVDREHPSLLGVKDTRPPNKDVVSIKLRIKVNDFPSRWNIRVHQIQCESSNLQAPAGCAQYYNTNSGNITSFNFLDGQYQKNMRIASCIKRDPYACGIEYDFKHFMVGDTKGGVGKLGYGLTCKDYLLINGEKTALCGSQTQPRKIVFPTSGPEMLFFSSDEDSRDKIDVGYSLEYRHLHDCENLEFFKYPVSKK
eukprot:TRINITY_DN6470_c0_g1_i1.p1 TRINITY_DN6470_c0_g1~~TRINITY_DN6470_c0_g1_i1.p1  ORF type:complete len:732 (+),score=85.38 TRINITY_DN6470_c0_g1_i1:111-2198(+)